MEKKTYHVTDAGGPVPQVAGKRRRPGDTVELTTTEAAHELSRGIIITDKEFQKLQDADDEGGKAPASEKKAK